MATVGMGYNTGTADTGYYNNKLKSLLDNPASFSGTPGFQFALNQGLDALNRQNSTIRGSGNALAALTDRASGMASQNYMDYLKTVGGLSGQEQSYDLGLAGAANTAQGNVNQLDLGHEANANTRIRNANDLTLGQGQLDNTRRAGDQSYGLGMYRAGNDFALGQEQNANTAQNNWWNYDNGRVRNANDYSVGMYNAQTGRGAAQSGAYNDNQRTQQDWFKVYPRQRIAGGY
jgi:hypothetical protein